MNLHKKKKEELNKKNQKWNNNKLLNKEDAFLQKNCKTLINKFT